MHGGCCEVESVQYGLTAHCTLRFCDWCEAQNGLSHFAAASLHHLGINVVCADVCKAALIAGVPYKQEAAQLTPRFASWADIRRSSEKKELSMAPSHRRRCHLTRIAATLLCLTAPLSVPGQVLGQGITNDHFWLNDVMAQVARNRRHPDQGRRCPVRDGKVMLQFAIDRTGRVLEASVKQSSGIADLDRQAIEMLRRASPLPPPPDFVRGQRLKFMLPIVFRDGGGPCPKRQGQS
jgi:TonB family protein